MFWSYVGDYDRTVGSWGTSCVFSKCFLLIVVSNILCRFCGCWRHVKQTCRRFPSETWHSPLATMSWRRPNLITVCDVSLYIHLCVPTNHSKSKNFDPATRAKGAIGPAIGCSLSSYLRQETLVTSRMKAVISTYVTPWQTAFLLDCSNCSASSSSSSSSCLLGPSQDQITWKSLRGWTWINPSAAEGHLMTSSAWWKNLQKLFKEKSTSE